MATLMVPVYGQVHIPDWVVDLKSFRRWIHSGALPDKLAVHFLRGDVWMDLAMEEAFTHNLVKTAVVITLSQIVREEALGLVFSDGMLLTNEAAGIATEPDAMFGSRAALKARRAWFSARTKQADATELVGSPDLVVEVVSRSSEDKDTEWLMTAYHDAGIPEYWLIDARPDPLRFEIFRRGAKGYNSIRKQAGWIKSPVLARSFRLTRGTAEGNYPVYELESR